MGDSPPPLRSVGTLLISTKAFPSSARKSGVIGRSGHSRPRGRQQGKGAWKSNGPRTPRLPWSRGGRDDLHQRPPPEGRSAVDAFTYHPHASTTAWAPPAMLLGWLLTPSSPFRGSIAAAKRSRTGARVRSSSRAADSNRRARASAMGVGGAAGAPLADRGAGAGRALVRGAHRAGRLRHAPRARLCRLGDGAAGARAARLPPRDPLVRDALARALDRHPGPLPRRGALPARRPRRLRRRLRGRPRRRRPEPRRRRSRPRRGRRPRRLAARVARGSGPRGRRPRSRAIGALRRRSAHPAGPRRRVGALDGPPADPGGGAARGRSPARRRAGPALRRLRSPRRGSPRRRRRHALPERRSAARRRSAHQRASPARAGPARVVGPQLGRGARADRRLRRQGRDAAAPRRPTTARPAPATSWRRAPCSASGSSAGSAPATDRRCAPPPSTSSPCSRKARSRRARGCGCWRPCSPRGTRWTTAWPRRSRHPTLPTARRRCSRPRAPSPPSTGSTSRAGSAPLRRGRRSATRPTASAAWRRAPISRPRSASPWRPRPPRPPSRPRAPSRSPATPPAPWPSSTIARARAPSPAQRRGRSSGPPPGTSPPTRRAPSPRSSAIP